MFKSLRRVLRGDQGPYTPAELLGVGLELAVINFFTLGRTARVKKALEETNHLLEVASRF